MVRDSRLSFRISSNLSKRIDQAIEESEGQIRDRSEFGTKAVTFYLDYIENTDSVEEVMLKSISKLAEKAGVSSEEVNYIRSILDQEKLIPDSISSQKTIDTHPKFTELIELRDKFGEDVQKEITNDLKDATYGDIDGLYEEYQERYHLEGIKPKTKKLSKEIKNE